MKALFISTLTPGSYSGGGHRSAQILAFLKRYFEDNVDVIFFNKDKSCFLGINEIFNVNYLNLNLYPLSVKKYYSKKLIEFVKKEYKRYRVIFIDHPHLLYIFECISNTSVLKITDFQNNDVYLSYEKLKLKKNPVFIYEFFAFKRYYKGFLRYSNLNFTVSYRDKEYIVKYNPETYFLRHCFFKYLTPKKNKDNRLVIIGNFDYRLTLEGVREFLKTYYIMDFKIPLLIIGNNANRYFKSDGLIQIVGTCLDFSEYILGSDICIIPVRYGSGSRVKVVTALSLGLPMAGTPKAFEGYPHDVVRCSIVNDEYDKILRDVFITIKNGNINIMRDCIRNIRDNYYFDNVYEMFKSRLNKSLLRYD